MDWYPKPHLRRFRLAAGVFLFGFDMPLKKTRSVCANVRDYSVCIFLKTRNRRVTRFHAERRWNFVLSCHPDPIGDQNDVQDLSIYCVIRNI